MFYKPRDPENAKYNHITPSGEKGKSLDEKQEQDNNKQYIDKILKTDIENLQQKLFMATSVFAALREDIEKKFDPSSFDNDTIANKKLIKDAEQFFDHNILQIERSLKSLIRLGSSAEYFFENNKPVKEVLTLIDMANEQYRNIISCYSDCEAVLGDPLNKNIYNEVKAKDPDLAVVLQEEEELE